MKRKQFTCLQNRHSFDWERNLCALENESETCLWQREMEREAIVEGLRLRKRGNSLQCGEGGTTPYRRGKVAHLLAANVGVAEAE